MAQLTKEDVINIIKEYNTTQGGTKSSFTIPLHRHNGSDSNKIIMGDLLLDNRGLIFPSKLGNISLNLIDSVNGLTDLTFVPPFKDFGTDLDVNFYLGTAPAYFNNIGFNSRNSLSILVGHDALLTQINTEYLFKDDHLEILSTASTIDGWYLRLPENTILPASPVPGDICFYGGKLQVCETAGVWTAK